MTSEVSEDAERASPANTQAHKTTNVYHRHESETVLTLVSFSRREEEEKIFFPPKIVSCFLSFSPGPA